MNTIKKKPSLFKKIFKYLSISLLIVILIFFVWSCIPIKQTVSPIQPRSDTKYWEMNGNYKIAYTLLDGDSANTNPVIIFLHGGPGGYIHSATIEQMREMSCLEYDVYLYDQIGSGLSDRLPNPKDYSFERHLSDLHEIIVSHIKSNKVILIGHSYGAILATHFTANHHEIVDKLVLSSPGDFQPYRTKSDGSMLNMSTLYPTPSQYQFKTPIEVFKQTERDFLQPRIIMSMFCAMTLNFKWASDQEFDDYTNTMASKFTKGMVANPKNVIPEEGGAGGYSHGFSNYYGNLKDIREDLKKLHIPTLVLQGQYDQGEYSSVYEYADLLNGKYVFIQDAGHIIWWDKPDEFNCEIMNFLK